MKIRLESTEVASLLLQALYLTGRWRSGWKVVDGRLVITLESMDGPCPCGDPNDHSRTASCVFDRSDPKDGA